MFNWREAFGYIDWRDSSIDPRELQILEREIPDQISQDNEVAKWIAYHIEEVTDWDLFSLSEVPQQAESKSSYIFLSPTIGKIFKYIPPESTFEDMNLSVPMYNILRRNGFDNFGDISNLKIEDLRNIGYLGHKKLYYLLTALTIYQALWFKVKLTKDIAEAQGPQSEKVPLDPLDFSWINKYSPVDNASLNASINRFALFQVLSGNGDAPLIADTGNLPKEVISDSLLGLTAKQWLGPVVIPSLEDLIFDLFDKWNATELKVLAERFLRSNAKTLDAIGRSVGLTRERIRQVEKKIKSDYASFNNQNWMHVALLQSLQQFASEPKKRSDFRRLESTFEVTHLGRKIDLINFYVGMGELENRDEWICSDFSSFDNLFDNVWETISTNGVSVDSLKFEEAYVDSAPNHTKKFIQTWLEYNGYAKFRKQWYLKRGKSITDLAEAVLTIRGESMTLEQIFEAMNVNKSIRSLHNTLITHEKFSKLGKHSWGLTEWNLETYSGIRDALLRYVEEKGTVTLSTLTKTFVDKYGVKASSVETYAQAYPLKVENGIVSKAPLKLENSHRKTIAKTRNMYQTPTGLTLRIKINSEHLRGSGSPCPAALASFLKLAPLEKRKLTWKHGTFMVSDVGSVTNLPSIRPACEELGIGIGEEILLIFDSNSVQAIKLISQESGGEYIRQVCQIANNQDIKAGLGFSLQLKEPVSTKQVIEVLESRKETDLIPLALKVMGNN